MRTVPLDDWKIKRLAAEMRRKYREDVEKLWKERNLRVDAARRLYPALRILEAVAKAHGYTVDDLRRWDRRARLCHARHHAIWELRRRRLDLGLQQIAAELNRTDHTTALHSYQTFCKLVADGRYAVEREAVQKELGDVA